MYHLHWLASIFFAKASWFAREFRANQERWAMKTLDAF
jgi:hypothetical protein